MRLLMVSTSYPRNSGDWRGVFIRHLAFALARQPGLSLALWAPPGDIPAGASSATTAAESRWLEELMAAGGISHLMRSGGLRGLLAPLKLLRLLAQGYRRAGGSDAYLVNWLQCAIPLPHDGKPLVLTCLGNDLKLLRLPGVKQAVRRALRDRPAAICPNAAWMEAPLREAFGDLARVQTVSFGIDPVWYAVDRKPAAVKRWLAVTRITRDKLGPLFDWSESHFKAGVRELHLFGPLQEPLEIPEWVHYHGPVTAQALAQTWFPEAQGLVTLSQHAEGRPQVMLEAMAAGLPIIASHLPAHKGLVVPGSTGALCGSMDEYLRALDEVEQPDNNRAHGEAARTMVAADVGTWDDCAARFLAVFAALKAQANG